MVVGGGGQSGEEMRVEIDFVLGDGRTVHCTDEVLLSCTLESCMVL